MNAINPQRQFQDFTINPSSGPDGATAPQAVPLAAGDSTAGSLIKAIVQDALGRSQDPVRMFQDASQNVDANYQASLDQLIAYSPPTAGQQGYGPAPDALGRPVRSDVSTGNPNGFQYTVYGTGLSTPNNYFQQSQQTAISTGLTGLATARTLAPAGPLQQGADFAIQQALGRLGVTNPDQSSPDTTHAVYTSSIPGADPGAVYSFVKNDPAGFFQGAGLQFYGLTQPDSSGNQRALLAVPGVEGALPITFNTNDANRTLNITTLDGHPLAGYQSFQFGPGQDGSGTKITQDAYFNLNYGDGPMKDAATVATHLPVNALPPILPDVVENGQHGAWQQAHGYLYDQFHSKPEDLIPVDGTGVPVNGTLKMDGKGNLGGDAANPGNPSLLQQMSDTVQNGLNALQSFADQTGKAIESSPIGGAAQSLENLFGIGPSSQAGAEVTTTEPLLASLDPKIADIQIAGDPAASAPVSLDGPAAPPTVDPNAVDPNAADPNAVDPNAIDPNAVDPSAVDPNAVDPSAVDPNAVDPNAVDPNAVDPNAVDPNAVDPNAVDPNAVDPNAVDPNAVDPNAVDPNAVDPNAVDPNAVDPYAVDPNAVDPNAVDPNAVDPNAVDPNAVDPNAVDPNAVNPNAVDPGYVDPGTTDPGYTDPGYTDPGYSDYVDYGSADAGGGDGGGD